MATTCSKKGVCAMSVETIIAIVFGLTCGSVIRIAHLAYQSRYDRKSKEAAYALYSDYLIDEEPVASVKEILKTARNLKIIIHMREIEICMGDYSDVYQRLRFSEDWKHYNAVRKLALEWISENSDCDFSVEIASAN